MKYDLYKYLSFPYGHCSICVRPYDNRCPGCINAPDDILESLHTCTISDHNFIIKNKIREYRDIYEITQTDLADLTGLTQNTISSYETGVYFPTLFNAMLIASVFGCSVDDLFEFAPS